jgi:hypothetical protein
MHNRYSENDAFTLGRGFFFSNPFPVSSVDVALDASIMDLSIERKVTLTR